ncbi:MAG: hypothetical protein KTR29_18845 [Rhodothermaceae bacterium]|nr:hypothetical protein [Rhodothermaceae bacterium]
MTQDKADSLAEYAEDFGLVNWSIADYHPHGLPTRKVIAFSFQGVADLVRLRRKAPPQLLEGTRTVIDTDKDRVTIY